MWTNVFGMQKQYSNELDDAVISVIHDSGLEVPYGRSVSFSGFFQDKALLSKIIQKGIPYSFFEKVRRFAFLSDDGWADALGISLKSLQRYKQSEKIFKPIQAEKIMEIAEVTQIGLEVFGSADKLNSWLETPSFALGNEKPIVLIKDSFGKELVISELLRIEHGIFV